MSSPPARPSGATKAAGDGAPIASDDTTCPAPRTPAPATPEAIRLADDIALEPGATVLGPPAHAIAAWTDKYFAKTKTVVGRFGDKRVTYALFMRRPVLFAPRPMVRWLEEIADARDLALDIELTHAEGDWVGAGEPLLYLTGSLYHLVDLETLYLQKLGASCVAAYNAYTMACELPRVAFLAMDARHATGPEMAELMAYACAIGSAAARAQVGAKGFVGNATDATAHYLGQPRGLGTMPHALIGYAGSTVRAAEMLAETFPGEPLTVLVDYFGREVSDGLAVCRRFPELARAGQLSLRLDTHGGRFIEGLDPAGAYAVLDRHAPLAIRRYRNETELRYLTGTGVSAAALFHFREQLDRAGFPEVKIVASSGFDVGKCQVMADVGAPIDVIGTGSFLPDSWRETYATADIVDYDGVASVKVGREFLLKKRRRGVAPQ